MGICYELVDHANKQIFDLGKGCWFVFKDYPEYFLYKEGIAEIILDEFAHVVDDQDLDQYWTKVVELLWEFVKNKDPEQLEILNDSSDGDKMIQLHIQDYVYVGSRYFDADDSGSLQKEIDNLNRRAEKSREREKLRLGNL